MTQQQGGMGIEGLCRLAGVARASYYRHWVKTSPREAEGELRDRIQRICLAHRSYGYRRVRAALRKQRRKGDRRILESAQKKCVCPLFLQNRHCYPIRLYIRNATRDDKDGQAKACPTHGLSWVRDAGPRALPIRRGPARMSAASAGWGSAAVTDQFPGIEKLPPFDRKPPYFFSFPLFKTIRLSVTENTFGTALARVLMSVSSS